MATVVRIIDDARQESIERDTSAARNEKPPDLRMKSVSPSGDMALRFTNKMEFPDGLIEELAEDERRRLEGEIDHAEGLNIELIYFPGLEDPMNSEIDLTWELKSITSDAINLIISF